MSDEVKGEPKIASKMIQGKVFRPGVDTVVNYDGAMTIENLKTTLKLKVDTVLSHKHGVNVVLQSINEYLFLIQEVLSKVCFSKLVVTFYLGMYNEWPHASKFTGYINLLKEKGVEQVNVIVEDHVGLLQVQDTDFHRHFVWIARGVGPDSQELVKAVCGFAQYALPFKRYFVVSSEKETRQAVIHCPHHNIYMVDKIEDYYPQLKNKPVPAKSIPLLKPGQVNLYRRGLTDELYASERQQDEVDELLVANLYLPVPHTPKLAVIVSYKDKLVVGHPLSRVSFVVDTLWAQTDAKAHIKQHKIKIGLYHLLYKVDRE